MLRLITSILLLLCSGALLANDWPQYMGPNRDGISTETNLAIDWSESGPTVAWTQDIGTGFAGVAIKDDMVYLLDRIDGEKDAMRCFDLNSGEELWRYENNDPGTYDFNGSRATPAVAGDHVYAVGAMGMVYAVDIKTGKAVWKRSFVDDFEAERPIWAFSQSPLVYKDLVIVAPLSKNAGVVAYKRDSGEIAWKTDRLCAYAGYASPSLVTIDGVEQIIQVTPTENKEYYDLARGAPAFDKGGVYGIEPATGKILWNYTGFRCLISITPVTVIGDGRFFITGGYDSSPTMIRVSKAGDDWAIEELFAKSDVKVQIHPALLYEDHLYMNGNDNNNKDGLICMNLEGEVLWRTRRKPNFGRSGLMIADKKIFMIDDKTGDLCVIDPKPAEYTEVARHTLLNKPQIWAPLALSNGKMIIRDQKQMKCLNLLK